MPVLKEQVYHPSGDTLLTALSRVSGGVGELVRAYPGPAGDTGPEWLDRWFRSRAEAHLAGTAGPAGGGEIPGDLLTDTGEESVAKAVRILSVHPNYFRGFRAAGDPVDLSARLTVLDGRNSSGKTSLAEALEWLFTGGLLRRSLGDLGNPRELENCIGNAFRPEGEDTWVEAVFSVGETEQVRLRRVLLSDYGSTSTSGCESKLYRDGVELSDKQALDLLDELFAGVAPILMQHSLRLFVHSSPRERREYFERLLRLDGLTHLIEKATIGNARIADIHSATGSVALARWEKLKAALQSPKRLRLAEKAGRNDLPRAIEDALVSVAQEEFGGVVGSSAGFGTARSLVAEAQKALRQKSFPLLADLRPKRAIDDSLRGLLSPVPLLEQVQTVRTAADAVVTARSAASVITNAELAIAEAFGQLERVGLIPSDEVRDQTCPLCAFTETPTLTTQRVSAIRGWEPIRQTVRGAEAEFDAAVSVLRTRITAIKRARHDLVPTGPSEERWTEALENMADPVAMAAGAVRRSAEVAGRALASVDQTLELLLTGELANVSGTTDHVATIAELVEKVAESLDSLSSCAAEYISELDALEKAVGTQAKVDPRYGVRELWLGVADAVEATAEDLMWERAKGAAHGELKEIREALIRVRQDLLERRRTSFNDGMSEVWQALRNDRYSAFGQLHIPEPKGKGFPIEIEVKAVLDNSASRVEVDALRVFSESQVNVLGIAAFVTRAKLLGHQLVILDDPVQSMDEDHFKTFAGPLLTRLLDEGFQVIVLTHNDTFARDVSYAHQDREAYATLRVGHRRKSGCHVEEGTRRFRERLKRMSRAIDNDDLKDGWLYARLAIERLYLIVYKKYGPAGFDPVTWVDQDARAMWNAGAGTVIEARVPGCGPRLAEIYTMAVAGAHDKATRGATDLSQALEDLRSLAGKLKIND